MWSGGLPAWRRLRQREPLLLVLVSNTYQCTHLLASESDIFARHVLL